MSDGKSPVDIAYGKIMDSGLDEVLLPARKQAIRDALNELYDAAVQATAEALRE